jgi:hypothetical protein
MKISAFPVVVSNPNAALTPDRNAGNGSARARNGLPTSSAANVGTNVAANDPEGQILQGEVLYSRSTPRSSASSSLRNSNEGYTSSQRERPGYEPRPPVNNFSRRIAVEAYQQNEDIAQNGLANAVGSIDVYA